MQRRIHKRWMHTKTRRIQSTLIPQNHLSKHLSPNPKSPTQPLKHRPIQIASLRQTIIKKLNIKLPRTNRRPTLPHHRHQTLPQQHTTTTSTTTTSTSTSTSTSTIATKRLSGEHATPVQNPLPNVTRRVCLHTRIDPKLTTALLISPGDRDLQLHRVLVA